MPNSETVSMNLKITMVKSSSMKLTNILKGILNEDGSHSYGCAMLYFEFPQLSEIHSYIDPNDVYQPDESYGLENDPHCTLLYGFHEEIVKSDIEEITKNFTFGTLTLDNPSLFENGKFDVLKFEVNGDNLYEVNSELDKLPNSNSFPHYHAHSTIAYLNPGKGKEYVELLKQRKLDKFSVEPAFIRFSHPTLSDTNIKINLTELGKTATYYKNNPEARKKKAKTDAKVNKQPEQLKKRVEANQARRVAKREGKNIKGKDASHTKNGIVFKDSSKNRGSKSDSPGDKRARGGKK